MMDSQPEETTPQLTTVNRAASEYWGMIAENGDPIPTGIACLDNALNGGLCAGRIYALMGEPGAGKTTLVNQIAEHIALTHPVLFLTFEESILALMAKTISRLGDLDYNKVLKGDQSLRTRIDETLHLMKARASADHLAYADDIALGPTQAEDMAKAHFGDAHGLLVVDYCQLWAEAHRQQLGGGRLDLREIVSNLMRDIRRMSNRLRCTTLLLSSMNRHSYSKDSDKTNYQKAVMTGGNESGGIERNADALLGLFDSSATVRNLHIAKNRMGERDVTLELGWRGDRQRFASNGTAQIQRMTTQAPVNSSPVPRKSTASKATKGVARTRKKDASDGGFDIEHYGDREAVQSPQDPLNDAA